MSIYIQQQKNAKNSRSEEFCPAPPGHYQRGIRLRGTSNRSIIGAYDHPWFRACPQNSPE